jgi:hypothetical protein
MYLESWLEKETENCRNNQSLEMKESCRKK